MSVNPLTRIFVAAALACVTLQAGAQQPVALQPLDSIRSAAEQALRAELKETAGVELRAATPDPRLRLSACGGRLQAQADAPRGSQSRVLVRVGCASGASWSVNVPVEVRRGITVFVLRRSVGRGEVLLPADVSAQQRVIPGLASPFVMRLEDLKGRHARRPLSEGTAITADALTPALLINRGQSVTLAASAGGIEVRAPGRALADASANQRVRVQNLDSLKVVEGVAESTGVVRVSP